jgi:hypothetical protein
VVALVEEVVVVVVYVGGKYTAVLVVVPELLEPRSLGAVLMGKLL